MDRAKGAFQIVEKQRLRQKEVRTFIFSDEHSILWLEQSW